MPDKQVMHSLAAVVAIGIALAAGPAMACKGSTVLLKEDFSKSSSAWAKSSDMSDPDWKDSVRIGGGRLLLKSPTGDFGYIYYAPHTFPDGDFCADVVMPDDSLPEAKWVGIALVAADGTYVLKVSYDQRVAVSKLSPDGDWSDPVPLDYFEALKTDPGSVNTLRLVWKSGAPTFSAYVNDKKVDTIEVEIRNPRIAIFFQTQETTSEVRNVLVTK